MYQSVLVHQADTYRYKPGQEDTTRRILSSARSDAGIYQVIHESQEDPAMSAVQTAGAWTLLLGRLRQAVAVLPIAARRWATSSQDPATSAEARGLLGEARQ
jgi:hypothetical protein